jgi:hypothetical protein
LEYSIKIYRNMKYKSTRYKYADTSFQNIKPNNL